MFCLFVNAIILEVTIMSRRFIFMGEILSTQQQTEIIFYWIVLK